MTPTQPDVGRLIAIALETRNWPLVAWLKALANEARQTAKDRRAARRRRWLVQFTAPD